MTANPHAPRWAFYKRVVDESIADRDSSILVVCAGAGDQRLLRDLGFTNVTISNLGAATDDFSPYTYAREDAENLSFEADAFDYTIVHAGLHHCQSPHRALLEMYRVCRRGALVVEARDSLTMRLATGLGLASQYEIEAVARGSSGLRDTGYPNYVYRWTEREVLKAIRSYAPHLAHRVRFFYGLCLPDPRSGSIRRRAVLELLAPLARIFAGLFPRQGNLFAFFVAKPRTEPTNLQPWMSTDAGDIVLDELHRKRYLPNG
ncbi:MAG: class I SAM-dependent methyltransferase [Burkholderiales bacterium]